MRRSLLKRISAAALSVLMCISMCGCGGSSEKTDNSIPEAPEAAKTVTQSKPAEDEKEETDVNIFDNNYDPFADDYDPYDGGGVSTVTAAAAGTESNDDEDDTPEATAAAYEETKPTYNGSPIQTTEKKNEPAQTEQQTQTEKSAPKEDKNSSASASEDGPALIISVPNGWSDGTSNFSQIDGTVKNYGSSVVDSWTAKIPVGKNASIEQSWNCGIDLKNGVLTITPVDFNKTISPGGEGTFGMIIKNPDNVDPKKCELKYAEGSVSASGNTYTGNSGNSGGSSGGGTPPPAPVSAKNVPKPTTDDWLSVKGSKIVDKNGKEVWITGINWFGYNTGTNTFDGLWTCDLNTSLAQIADHGFNLLRVPISAELINNWSSGSYPTANFNQATNSYLVGMNSLEIFDYVIGQCRANGIKIMIDIHSAKTDSMGHMKNMWYEGNVTEKDYLAALSWMAERYKNDDTIIAYDVKNEPHGKANESPRAKWDGSKDSDNWKYIAEKAAKAVLDKNPNVLIMVEGIEIYPKDIKTNGDFSSTNMGDYYSTWWGGNLRGVKDNPVNLGKYQNKLVYSPHDYGPAVYQQEWFKGDYTYESLYKDAWHDNWFYIQENGTAPLLIGEWGGFMTQPNLKWMTYLRKFIKEKRINHTFWCFNANSGDTGGLVKDDFVTWDKEKYDFVKEVLWQEDGKFVGLDHEIPLGTKGKVLGS